MSKKTTSPSNQNRTLSRDVHFIDDPESSCSRSSNGTAGEPLPVTSSAAVPTGPDHSSAAHHRNRDDDNTDHHHAGLVPISIPPPVTNQCPLSEHPALRPFPIITTSAYHRGLLHGRFTKVRRVGQGAVAKVYQFRDTITGADIAVKKFNRHWLRSQRIYHNAAASSELGGRTGSGPGGGDPSGKLTVRSLWDRAEHEVKVLQYLHQCGTCPELVHICPVYAVIDDAELDHMFILMEFAPRGVAVELDPTGYQFEPKTLWAEAPAVSELYTKLLAALAGLRTVGVIHNDLKPANIVITQDGCPKLIDFGEAIVVPWKYPDLMEHFLTKVVPSQQPRSGSGSGGASDAGVAVARVDTGVTNPGSLSEQAQTGALACASPAPSHQSPCSPSQVVTAVLDIDTLFDNDDDDNGDDGDFELAGLENNGVFRTIDLDLVTGPSSSSHPTTTAATTTTTTTTTTANNKNKSSKTALATAQTITVDSFGPETWYQLGTIAQGPGTPFFGSPETCIGPYNGFDNELWALGVCLFAAVLGYLPFFSLQNNPQATMFASLELIQRGQVSWISPLPRPVPVSVAFKALITTILNPDVETRPTLAQCRAVLPEAAAVCAPADDASEPNT